MHFNQACYTYVRQIYNIITIHQANHRSIYKRKLAEKKLIEKKTEKKTNRKENQQKRKPIEKKKTRLNLLM